MFVTKTLPAAPPAWAVIVPVLVRMLLAPVTPIEPLLVVRTTEPVVEVIVFDPVVLVMLPPAPPETLSVD